MKAKTHSSADCMFVRKRTAQCKDTTLVPVGQETCLQCREKAGTYTRLRREDPRYHGGRRSREAKYRGKEEVKL